MNKQKNKQNKPPRSKNKFPIFTNYIYTKEIFFRDIQNNDFSCFLDSLSISILN